MKRKLKLAKPNSTL